MAAQSDGEMVGTAVLDLSLCDNTHMAYIEVLVPPRHRGLGIGSALLVEAEARAVVAGRTHALAEVAVPPGAESAGSRFAAKHGYLRANLEGQKVIDLAASESGWAALEVEAQQAIGDYRVVTWRDETPEEYVVGFCDLLSRFMGQIPLGEVALNDSEWTPERLRRNEERSREIGRMAFLAAAVTPEGTLVGTSDIRLAHDDPGKAFIGITMVDPGHRGHRLGLAMKLATHRLLRSSYPQCRVVVTSNADVNEHMNSINERMGYALLEDLLEMQKELPGA